MLESQIDCLDLQEMCQNHYYIYIDEESDICIISSDFELQEAIRLCFCKNIASLKIYLLTESLSNANAPTIIANGNSL